MRRRELQYQSKTQSILRKILIALGVKRQRQTAEYMLRCILPANLTIEIDLMYNRHIDLKRFTHGRMKELMYTHHDLRAEVLADA